jgi:hypothetical protein
VRLTRNPGPAGATVQVSTQFGLTTQTPSVTFTGGAAGNWNVYQAVDLKPERDDDVTQDTYMVTFILATTSATRMVRENPDTTIIIGYDNSGTPGTARTFNGLEGWGWAPVIGQGPAPTQLPPCVEITKLFAMPSAATSGAQVHAGLYVGSGSAAGSQYATGVVYDPGARDVNPMGIPLNDAPQCMPMSANVFVAASTTAGLMLQTRMQVVQSPWHCQRTFTGGALPNPFFFGVAFNCPSTDAAPPKIWFIGYPSSSCVCTPPM